MYRAVLLHSLMYGKDQSNSFPGKKKKYCSNIFSTPYLLLLTFLKDSSELCIGQRVILHNWGYDQLYTRCWKRSCKFVDTFEESCPVPAASLHSWSLFGSLTTGSCWSGEGSSGLWAASQPRASCSHRTLHPQTHCQQSRLLPLTSTLTPSIKWLLPFRNAFTFII